MTDLPHMKNERIGIREKESQKDRIIDTRRKTALSGNFMFLARSAFRLSCHLFLCRPSFSFSFHFWLHERFPSQRFIFFSTPRCAVGSDSDVTWNWWWKATPGAFLRVIRSKKQTKKKEKTLRRINSLDWIVALHAFYLIVTCNNNFVNAIIT